MTKPADTTFELFPRTKYLDGEPRPDRWEALAAEARDWARADPDDAARHHAMTCQTRPKEFYEGAVMLLDQVLELFAPEAAAGYPIPFVVFDRKIRKVRGAMYAMLNVMAARKSVFEKIT